MEPGRGPPVYQPATAVDAGTCSVPAFVTPRSTSLVWTPMAGIVSATGNGTPALCGRATAAIGPTGAGMGAAAGFHCGTAGWRAVTSPAAPAPARTRPAASVSVAKIFLLFSGHRRIVLPPTTMGWRSSQRRSVVAMTVGHDGSGRCVRPGRPMSRYSISGPLVLPAGKTPTPTVGNHMAWHFLPEWRFTEPGKCAPRDKRRQKPVEPH